MVELVGGGRVVVVSAGTSVKITAGFVTVVAGARGTVVATVGAGRGAGGVVVAGAAVVEGVFSPKRAVAGTDAEVAPGSLLTVDGVGSARVVAGCGRDEITRAVEVRSRAVAASTMATNSAPTPMARKVFCRAVVLLASHHIRTRSDAGGRPNAAFLPMDG